VTLRLYNTLTRRKEAFAPRSKKLVTLYTCGPTVYAPAHIGNLRTYVFEDILRRWLGHGEGYDVCQVMNITDVEDKIIRDSKARDVAAMQAYTQPFEQRFREDLVALGVEPAEHYPRATEYVSQMIALIERIITAGFAYERDGSVYFDVRRYNEDHVYGQLATIDFAGFSEHRIDNDEYDKENVQDFALWKRVAADSPGWDSPWGWGRPGWHIECSAMAQALLDDLPIDIHTGGVDNIFPHHENEIAQTSAGEGKDLARFWLHAEHLLVDGKKMAKSENNFYTLDEIVDHGYDAATLRMLYVSAHYRSKVNFSWQSLEAAKQSQQRIDDFLSRLGGPFPGGTDNPGEVTGIVSRSREAFDAALRDDLNTPEALSVIFELIRELNTLLDRGAIDDGEALAIRDAFDAYDRVLGVIHESDKEVPEAVAALIEQRRIAREEKDFAASDRLRDEIAVLGWSVEDTPSGQRVRNISQ
jgi:cysteinyl-tRNA synthetase